MKFGRSKGSFLSLGSAGLVVCLLQLPCAGGIQAQTANLEQERPLRIVVTNDDGVEELEDRVVPLARALAAFADVYVVIPARNRSGTTHHMSLSMGRRALESELVWSGALEEGGGEVEVHVVEGYPADCVALALGGIQLVLGLEPGSYLTVALPQKSASEIRGIRVAPRAAGLGGRYFEKAPPLIGEGDAGPRQVWLLQVPAMSEPPPADTDIGLYVRDYIVVTPMRADEHDYALMDELRGRLGELPAWPPEQRP